MSAFNYTFRYFSKLLSSFLLCYLHVWIFSAYAGTIPTTPAAKCSREINIKEKLHRKFFTAYNRLSTAWRETYISLNWCILWNVALWFLFCWKQTSLMYLIFKLALKCGVNLVLYIYNMSTTVILSSCWKAEIWEVQSFHKNHTIWCKCMLAFFFFLLIPGVGKVQHGWLLVCFYTAVSHLLWVPGQYPIFEGPVSFLVFNRKASLAKWVLDTPANRYSPYTTCVSLIFLTLTANKFFRFNTIKATNVWVETLAKLPIPCRVHSPRKFDQHQRLFFLFPGKSFSSQNRQFFTAPQSWQWNSKTGTQEEFGEFQYKKNKMLPTGKKLSMHSGNTETHRKTGEG